MKREPQNKKFADWLYSNPEFIEDVRKIRKNFNIPEGGFTDDRKIKGFLRKLSKDSEEKMEENSEFFKKTKKIKKEYSLGKISKKDLMSGIKCLEKTVLQFAINQEIRDLRLKHKIPVKWYFSLYQHIIADEKHYTQSCVPGIFSLPGGEAEIRIIVDANATLNDIKNIWPTIKEYQKQLNDYRKTKLRKQRNFKRNSNIMKLYSEGLSHNEIAQKINAVSKTKEVIGYEYISKIIKRYKERGH